MSTHFSWAGRLARRITDHAASVLAPTRPEWARAMKHEIAHIPGDLPALWWAVGCLLAGYTERSATTSLLRLTSVRVMLALVIVGQAATFFFATALTISYRTEALGAAQLLGSFTPGDDYRRFIPLMHSVPWWLHTMWLVASALFLLAAWDLVRNHDRAFPAFASAVVVGTLGNLISFRLPEYQTAFRFDGPNVMRDYVLPGGTMITFVVVATSLWVHRRWSMVAGASTLPSAKGRQNI